MKIIVVCISLALVVCTRGKKKSYIDGNFRLSGVERGGRWLRSAARGVSKEITGAFYIPPCSRGNLGGRGSGGGGSHFQNLNFQDFGIGTGSLSNQVGNGAAASNYFQGWGTHAGGVSNEAGSAGGSISNIQGWSAGVGGVSIQGGSGRGGRSLPGPIGYAAGFQDYSKGAGGFSNQGGSGLSGYQKVLVDLQTSEGRNIDPQLLEQVRSILLQEEASSGLGGGTSPSFSSFSAPSSSYGARSTSFGAFSSAYGAPSAESGGRYVHGKSGRVVGIVLEGIYQSIQIGQTHQTTSQLGPSSGISPVITSPIPSHTYLLGFPK